MFSDSCCRKVWVSRSGVLALDYLIVSYVMRTTISSIVLCGGLRYHGMWLSLAPTVLSQPGQLISWSFVPLYCSPVETNEIIYRPLV